MARTATVFWCDHCEEWAPCESVNYGDYSSMVGQREFEDGTRVFRRWRECKQCRNTFSTIEISEDVLDQKNKALKAVARAISKLK